MIDFTVLDNEYVSIVLSLFLGLYAMVLSRVDLPDYIRNLFNNSAFRVLWLSLLLIFNFNKTPHIAITVALVFILTLDYLNKKETRENFVYLNSM
jgi:hypothetical protein